VSAAPPAAAIELEPKEQAAISELDQQIESVQAEIAEREETLATLISTSDEDRTTPLVDDPAFREISQRLPKLQADLQTLRERRNKIQPTASTP
jgi:prefoldin subunit 5